MKHLYKIFGLVALILLIGLLIALYIHGKNNPQDFSGETTQGTTAVAINPSFNETQPGQTTTTLTQGDPQIPNITIPKDDLTDDTIPDATPAETTAPEYSWTGGGIVLPGDDLEGL